MSLAALITLASLFLLPPIPAALASIFGVLISGLLAGKLASEGRLYHGALVGAGYVVCEAVGLVPGLGYFADPLSETVAVIVSDALLIAVGALGGWAARLWSSSDTDTGR